jgi:S1-C subfamily serine protease
LGVSRYYWKSYLQLGEQMKKLFVLLFSCVLLQGCERDIYYLYDGQDAPHSVNDMIEYNVIFYDEIFGPLCGATVLESTEETTIIVTVTSCLKYGGPYYIQPTDENLYGVELIYSNENSNLSLLRATSPIPIQISASVRSDNLVIGEVVWTLGYPAGVPDALSKGVLSKRNTLDNEEREMDQFDITGWFGSEGGGVFDSNGLLVSIISDFGPQAGSYGETGWMLGVPTNKIRSFVNAEAPME